MITLYGKEFNPKSILAHETFKPVWRERMTDEQYHGDKSAVGSSSLRKAKKSLMAFAGAMWGPEIEPTDPMKFGTLVHMAILEPSKFKSRYFVEPEFVGVTKDGKVTTSKNAKDVQEKYAKWTSELPKGAVVVTEDERSALFNMIESVLSHPTASQLLTNVKTELAGFYRDEKTGILIKIKHDIFAFTGDIQADLKTCQDSYWPEFRRTVESKKYYFQDAMYAQATKEINGVMPESRAWIAVENKYPFETRVHEVCPVYKEAGANEYRHCLDKVKKGIDENSFPPGQLEPELTQPSIWFEKEHGDMY